MTSLLAQPRTAPTLSLTTHVVRLFIDQNIVTSVAKDGRVVCLPDSLRPQDEQRKIHELRQWLEQTTQATQNMATNMLSSINNPFDFVSNAMNGMLGK